MAASSVRVDSPRGHWLGGGRGGTARSIVSSALLRAPLPVLPRVLSAVAMVVVSDLAARTAAGDALALLLRPKVRVELPNEDEDEGLCVAVDRKEVREAAGEGSGVVVAVPERSSGELLTPEAS